MSKKRLGLITAALAFLILSLLIWAQAAERNTIELLQQSGFTEPLSYKSKKSFGAVNLTNLKLDADNASTIKSLKAAYSFKNNATLLIDHLDLTGDTLEGKLSIPGLKPTASPLTWPSLPIDKIILKNARLALLTKNWSGLNININAQIFRNDPSTLQAQTRFTSKQNTLTFGGQATGTITLDKIILKGDIEHLKINLPHTKLTRANGSFTLTQRKNQPPEITLKIKSGGANILGLPWKNLNGTLTHKENTTTLNATATANTDKPIQLTATEKILTLSAPTQQNLKIFLTDHNREDLTALIRTTNDRTATLTTAWDTNSTKE